MRINNRQKKGVAGMYFTRTTHASQPANIGISHHHHHYHAAICFSPDSALSLNISLRRDGVCRGSGNSRYGYIQRRSMRSAKTRHAIRNVVNAVYKMLNHHFAAIATLSSFSTTTTISSHQKGTKMIQPGFEPGSGAECTWQAPMIPLHY